jgi:hypothetical protein
LEPIPASEFCVDAERAAATAGAAATTDSTASAGAAATGAPLLNAAAVTGSEGVKVVVMRGVATSLMVVVSRADPAFLED